MDSWFLWIYNLNGLITCYLLAIPFFGNTLISTILFSIVIEGIIKINFVKNLFPN